MRVSLARFISFVTNPFFIAIPLPFLLVYHETDSISVAIRWTFFSVVFLLMIGAFVFYEVKRHVFSDIDVSKKEQRPLFFVYVIFVSLLYLGSLVILRGPFSLFIAVGGVLGSAVALGFVNRKIKASLHVATVSAFFTVFALLYGGMYVLLLLAIPIVAWSRITIKRHSLKETVVGCVMGIMLTLIVYFSTLVV
ncbi:MAG: hypothetical protein RLZZ455_25 [Candidatus Parcubacteria bacterium]|jgi:hypothetical protein